MKKSQMIFLIFVVIFGLKSPAYGKELPTVLLAIGGATTETPMSFIGTSTLGLNTLFTTDQGSIDLSLTVKYDPMYAFSITAKNLEPSPLLFGFTFLVPETGDATHFGHINLSGTLTDSTGDGGGLSPGPSQVVPLVFNYISKYDHTTQTGGIGPSAKFGPDKAGSVHLYGLFNKGSGFPYTFSDDGPFTGVLFGASVSFFLSGFDAVTLSGSTDISYAPVPSAMMLLSSGLLALAVWRKFRRN